MTRRFLPLLLLGFAQHSLIGADVIGANEQTLAQTPNGVNLYVNPNLRNAVFTGGNSSTKPWGSYHYPTDSLFNGKTTGMKWQCVEFVNRFYGHTYGMLIRNTGGHGKDYFGSAGARNLAAYANGNINAPQAGDLLCFNYGPYDTKAKMYYGHVAIVSYLDLARGKVVAYEQNWSPTGMREYSITYSGGRYTIANPPSNFRCQGWLRPVTRTPRALYASPTQGEVSFSWTGHGAATGDRIQISTTSNGWSSTSGFASPIVSVARSFPAELSASRSAQYLWYSSPDSSYSGTTWRAPREGETVWWSVRQNFAGQVNKYTEPKAITLPSAPPSMYVSIVSVSATVNQGSNAEGASFYVSNQGGGTLSYNITRSHTWVSVSPTSSSLLKNNSQTHNITFDTSTLAAGSYNATLTVTPSNSGLSSFQIAVSLTVNAVAQPPDDHSNTNTGPSNLPRGGSRTGVMDYQGDVDYFFIRIYTAGYYRIYSTGSTDVLATIYDRSSGDYVDDNDDDGSGHGYTSAPNFYMYTYLEPGIYDIRVEGYRGTATGSYTIFASDL